jgi:Inosine-uridine preferring nucleoside hydrolase
MPKKIVLDCDPGIDDAWAIVLACGDPELELCGITTVAGNASLATTTANALRVCEFIGADIPVAAGSPVSLQGSALGSGDMRGKKHGACGLGEARLPEPTTRPLDVHATDFLAETISAAPGALGPGAGQLRPGSRPDGQRRRARPEEDCMSSLHCDITQPGPPRVEEVSPGVYAYIQPDGSNCRVLTTSGRNQDLAGGCG